MLVAKRRSARSGVRDRDSGRGAAGAAARCARDSWRPGQRRAAAASHEFSWLGRPRGCDVVDANLAERAATSHQPALAFRLSFSGCVYSVTLNHIKILIIANDADIEY